MFLSIVISLLLTQAQQGTAQLRGFRTAPALFQQNCGTCHGKEGSLSISVLQEYSPERLYESLTIGKMKEQAASLTDVQKRTIAEFLAARPSRTEAGDMKNMTNRCASNAAMTDPASGPAWNGWGAGTGNARFQTAIAAGLTADQVPK
ncbi:MAG: hypothetical protein DMG11_34265, partial [Acidobacteria bacterium]